MAAQPEPEISNFDPTTLSAKGRRLRQLVETLYEHVECWVRDNDVKASEFVATMAAAAARTQLAAGMSDELVTERMAALTRAAIAGFHSAEEQDASVLINTRKPATDEGGN